jgi:hypothetical protein
VTESLVVLAELATIVSAFAVSSKLLAAISSANFFNIVPPEVNTRAIVIPTCPTAFSRPRSLAKIKKDLQS